jgi:proteasome lid subunit RPN8/RPN11
MTKQVHPIVTISSNAQKTLLTDVYIRRHIEACGLFTGSIDGCGNWHIEQVHPLPNIFNSSAYFEFAPEDILSVELEYPGQVVGAYHSHPTGLTVASSTDRQNMKRVNLEQQIPWVWLIISGPFDEMPTSFHQVRSSSRRGRGPSIIAYHHYDHHGLRQVPIQFAEAPATPSPVTQEQSNETA